MAAGRKPFVLHEQTLSRRTLLEWLGQAAVLSLSGSYLTACLGGSGAGPAPAPDGGEPQGSFSFSDGEPAHAVYGGWGERTVDRQDLARILGGWRLTVGGMVESPAVLTFGELVALPRQEQLTDFHCVEGWSIYDVPWNGVHLSHLAELVRPTAAVTHVTFWTVGRQYNESLPLDVALEPRTMLGYGIDGYTLPLSHGFPLRVVIPRLLGYKNAKYVEGIEFTDHPVAGYWVDAGYRYDGAVPASRLRDGKW